MTEIQLSFNLRNGVFEIPGRHRQNPAQEGTQNIVLASSQAGDHRTAEHQDDEAIQGLL